MAVLININELTIPQVGNSLLCLFFKIIFLNFLLKSENIYGNYSSGILTVCRKNNIADMLSIESPTDKTGPWLTPLGA